MNAHERTSIATVVPERPCVHSLILLQDVEPLTALHIVSAMNSFAYDYLARQKIAGNHFNQTIWKQLPLVGIEAHRGLCGLIGYGAVVGSALELTYTAWDLEAFALDCGYSGPPFRWDEERRFMMRCELDAAYFHLYLGSPNEWGADSPQLREMFPTSRHAVDYIMETFPIVRRKDIARTEIKNGTGEVSQPGRYITKDIILEIYDAMQQAIDTGQPYQTRLNPPPGPPTDAEGNFIPAAQWDQNNWPSHVHLPRPATVEIPKEIAAVRVERGRVVLDILLLLEAWDKPVSISALEPALVLMRNEAARRSLLSRGTAVVLNVDLLEEPQFVRGLDLIYQGLEANGAIRRVGQSAFELAAGNLVTDAPDTDRERVAETLQAINSLRDIRTLPQVVASLTNERYEVTV